MVGVSGLAHTRQFCRQATPGELLGLDRSKVAPRRRVRPVAALEQRIGLEEERDRGRQFRSRMPILVS